jgi:hypothetical protein
MKSRRFEILLAGAALVSALAACMQSEPKSSREEGPAAADNPVRQVSAQMSKPYLLNEKGEIIAEIAPEILASMKENLRREANLTGADDLERLYDPATGKLRDAAKLAEIQHEADSKASALSKGAAR